MIQGIDVSVVQGKIDWTKVDPAIRFVYAKCGEGNAHPVKDGTFDANIAGAKATGRIVGAYHFPYPLPVVAGHADRDARLQAQAHFDASEGLGAFVGELPPVADCEWPAPQDWAKWGCTADSIKSFMDDYLDEMDRLHGKPGVTAIYIYPDFAHHLGDLSRYAGRTLWLASYAPKPAVVPPWKAPDIWQSSGGGGKLYNGRPVDTNVIADEDTLARLLSR